MIATVHTGSLSGVDALGVVVEISQARGLPGFDIVGMPEAALRESRVRVVAAISNSGLQLPDRRYVVNLAPADLRKSGASFDLAIAIALLVACGLCRSEGLEHTLIIGELSLDGRLRSVRGAVAHLRSAARRGLRAAIVPEEDAAWAALVPSMRVQVAHDLRQVVEHFEGTGALASVSAALSRLDLPDVHVTAGHGDLQDVLGQESAKRALEVAAAGAHNVLMVGPPGAGKTMLARRLPGLLPEPTAEEALEIATIRSVAGDAAGLQGARAGLLRPFRAPHHSCSEAALVGGGHPIRPGEVTLAHGGVLFLDELPEFRRNAIEALRPIMESGVALVARAREHVCMPARPLLVAAMNPCPCGFAGDVRRVCRCSLEQVQRYQARVSGPVIDRFDLHLQLRAVSVQALDASHAGATAEPSSVVRARVCAARAGAAERRARAAAAGTTRAARGDEHALDQAARQLLTRCIDRLGLSLRAYAKVLRISSTLADLEGSTAIHARHVSEAVQYRLLDRDPSARISPADAHAADGGSSN